MVNVNACLASMDPSVSLSGVDALLPALHMVSATLSAKNVSVREVG